MLIFITAIAPEAEALLTAVPMKKIKTLPFSLYESDDANLRLLVCGVGKLNAAIAVTAYLTEYPCTGEDIFCNLGICGGSPDTSVGKGFFCAAVTDFATQSTYYPELYTHPFSEAQLVTSDLPVTDGESSEKEGTLPVLYDMEAYGIAAALYRSVPPFRCFFYKIVSDLCNGVFPVPREVTALLLPHLPALLNYLSEKEQALRSAIIQEKERAFATDALIKEIIKDLPFSATMERKLRELITYALFTGMTGTDLLQALPEPADTPHKKKEALFRLNTLEAFVKQPLHSLSEPSVPTKKQLHPFRHIYVEREVLSHAVTKQLTERFRNASVIPIRHYKDVFNRSKQHLASQETEPSLILAANHGTLFYPGAPVCQSFGEEHFMYTSCIMNCMYDCDYCYLQGMYPSGNLVVFVNLEDYFSELDKLLAQHPVYLCCSYDSDITALNGLLPHAEAFCRYALQHPNLRLELRTKSAALPFIKKLPAAKNIVMAFTLSPQEIIQRYEHYTPSLKARLAAAKESAKQGFSLRLCFDPILDVPNAEALYSALTDEVFRVLCPEEITDISLGVFRLSKDYLKQLKKAKPACALSHYPYELTNGVCHYDNGRCETLLTSVCDALYRHGISSEKLFIWTPDESKEGESHVNR